MTPSRKMESNEIRARFPLADLVPGWFFRNREVSMGHFVAEGTDLFGRTVSASGAEEDALEQAVRDAKEMQRTIDEHQPRNMGKKE